MALRCSLCKLSLATVGLCNVAQCPHQDGWLLTDVDQATEPAPDPPTYAPERHDR